MEKVLTITLNPAIDKSTTISALLPAKKLRCTSPEFHPGGGGINVSSVLAKFGYASTAMFLAGGFTGSFFEKLVQQQGIETMVAYFSGYTRENVIVHDLSTDLQYRFSFNGSRWGCACHREGAFSRAGAGYKSKKHCRRRRQHGGGGYHGFTAKIIMERCFAVWHCRGYRSHNQSRYRTLFKSRVRKNIFSFSVRCKELFNKGGIDGRFIRWR